MSCAHEHHAHGGHGDECGHNHGDGNGATSVDGPDRGAAFSLYRYINVERAWCLNERVEGSVRGVFKPWAERLDVEKVCLWRTRCCFLRAA